MAHTLVRKKNLLKLENSSRKGSVIYEHLQENNTHNFDWKDFNILGIEKNYEKRDISEILFIKSQKSSINKREDNCFLSNIYCNKHHICKISQSLVN